ncbi:DUF1905 domain-containing protein [Paenibacillus athensensis]|uniref:DUF1905 domain-containing protein n=1 Tax=Paenibacillus athensensis TaxID=1967502 RepID=A0A4Y8Q8U3_9BACL|nr:YdeI/OmpD-associated family protein [Paenibacillus athensensis]MCD1260095.1 DUF1905 domain-containing protein [Paenibacillus athensensis]
MQFQSTVMLSGKTATGLEVPPDIVEALGSGKKPAVTVTINGYAYRTTVATMGGRFMIPLSAEHRAGCGVSAGDEVEVGIELDTQVREMVPPDDFQAALNGEEAAAQFWAGLSYSNKRRVVLNIEGAKTAETRQRRIDKAVALLKEGQLP